MRAGSCCLYGTAAILLDGVPTAHIHASSPGFPHHVMQVATVGVLNGAGNHTVSVRVVGAGPNGTHQFRLAWLHVAAPVEGLQVDSDYRIARAFRTRPARTTSESVIGGRAGELTGSAGSV